MYIFGKRVDELNELDILRLIENSIQETKSLDYKRELKLGADKERKEFLFDVTAMYNTEGGCLVFGIEEDKDENGHNTGKPKSISGIPLENMDKLTQLIEDLVKGNTEPNITNIAIKQIVIEDKSVLILGIPKGFGLPAMVTFNEVNKFYRRRNSGKYSVDVYELNQMFMQNQLIKERVEEFRLQRIEKVRTLKVFPNLDVTTSLFIQLIPFNFLNEQTIDLSNAVNMNLKDYMFPMFSTGYDRMFNIDGYATFLSELQKIIAYDQIFRNGIYEMYASRFLYAKRNTFSENVNLIDGDCLVPNILKKVTDGLNVLNKFNIEPPFFICLSFHGVLGSKIQYDRSYTRPFVIEDIILPPIVLSTYETNIYSRLKPLFDIVWQAAGISKSPIYKENC